MWVNRANVANLNIANISFHAVRENKIPAKISEFSVVKHIAIYA